MLAARLYGPKDVRLDEVPIPACGDNEVLLRVKAAAVCGTDIRMINNGTAGADEKHPLTLGHELSGIIHEVGKNLTGKYTKGMRVAVAPNMGCGACGFCASGNSHLCQQTQALGINLPGGFAQYAVIPAEACNQGNIIELGDNVSYAEAAINEPLSCAYNSFLRYRVNPGDIVVIIGAGPVGLMHARLCRMAGAAKVIINDISEERLAVSRRLDPWLITVGEGLKEKLMEITRGHGADVCITACSAPAAQASAFALMAMDGRVNFFGGLPKGKEVVPLDTNLIHYKQLTVTGTTRASVAMFRKTLELVADGLLKLSDLVSGEYPIADFMTAVEKATAAEGLKNVIVFPD
jgi:L-iditol 2-dehydrogenase